jgi:hypothetical protein
VDSVRRNVSNRQETVENLRTQIAEWDEKELGRKGKAGKRLLEHRLHEIEKNDFSP